VAIIGFPVFIGVVLTANLFVPLFFGEKWLDTIEVIQILSFAMIFQILTANIATSVLYSINRPNLVLIIDIISNALYITILFLLSSKGIFIILILYSINTILKAVFLQFAVGKELN